ncbi:MAG: hypothetical protein WBL70_17800 [Candidatus Acidiferrales bacterium]
MGSKEQVLILARKKAERSVADMADGELKTKAFEVILQKLLLSGPFHSADPVPASLPPVPGDKARAAAKTPISLRDRLLAIRADGFFAKHRTLGEVRAELAARGWHYPLTSLSGAMQALVRSLELRREQVSAGLKKSWRYSNA